MALIALNDEGEVVDEDDDDDEVERKVMAVVNAGKLQLVARPATRVCSKHCHVYEPALA